MMLKLPRQLPLQSIDAAARVLQRLMPAARRTSGRTLHSFDVVITRSARALNARKARLCLVSD
jgi:hypothetical protein